MKAFSHLAAASNSSSPIKKQSNYSKKHSDASPITLNTSYHINNSIILFQDSNYQALPSPGKGGRRLNSSMVEKRVASNLTKVNAIGNSTSSMNSKPNPYSFTNSTTNKIPSSYNTNFSAFSQKQATVLESCPKSCSKKVVFTPLQLTELYTAKSQDLKLQYFQNQEYRFHEYCKHNCINRRVILKEVKAFI